MKKIEGNIIDIYNNRIFPGTICIDHGIITDILENSNSYQNFIAGDPGRRTGGISWFYRCSCTY